MEKKLDKKNKLIDCFVNYGFWAMIAFFVLMILLSVLKLQWPSLVAGVLFVIAVFFVFITSIIAVAPEGKSMAYVALAITILFIIYVIFSATISASSVLG
jgi:hypothetical protein